MDKQERKKESTLGPPSKVSNVLEFPRDTGYDPLEDPQIIEMMQRYYQAGEVDMFGLRNLKYKKGDPEEFNENDMPEQFKAWLEVNRAHINMPDHEMKAWGLSPPVVLVRAPATRGPAKFEALRLLHGIGGLKAQHMILGSWFFKKPVNQEIMERFCWMEEAGYDAGVGELLVSLQRSGNIIIDEEGFITPTRVMLYRAIECVSYLVDTLAPLVFEFVNPEYAEKLGLWPSTEKEVPKQ